MRCDSSSACGSGHGHLGGRVKRVGGHTKSEMSPWSQLAGTPRRLRIPLCRCRCWPQRLPSFALPAATDTSCTLCCVPRGQGGWAGGSTAKVGCRSACGADRRACEVAHRVVFLRQGLSVTQHATATAMMKTPPMTTMAMMAASGFGRGSSGQEGVRHWPIACTSLDNCLAHLEIWSWRGLGGRGHFQPSMQQQPLATNRLRDAWKLPISGLPDPFRRSPSPLALFSLPRR